MPVVYSTASADQIYPRWDNHPRVGKYESAVLIKGGAGVQRSKTFITPRGVATYVTDEELEFLKTVPAFVDGEKKGYFAIDEKARKPSQERAEEVAEANLEKTDGGAQKTDEDFKKSGKKPPKKTRNSSED